KRAVVPSSRLHSGFGTHRRSAASRSTPPPGTRLAFPDRSAPRGGLLAVRLEMGSASSSPPRRATDTAAPSPFPPARFPGDEGPLERWSEDSRIEGPLVPK